MPALEDIIRTSSAELTPEDKELINRAYSYAQKAHSDQKRLSGEPYFLHLSETAKILASLGMDAKTIAAGLLHDTIEDAKALPEEVEKEFGKEILFLIEGVTKLGQLKYRGLERHAESLRKLFIATAHDLRVIMIRLADRLHNMKTLEHLPSHKRKRIASETLQIYAPIANRLGMGKMKGELEDLAFPHVHPLKYKEVVELRKQKSKENVRILEELAKKLKKEMAASKIKVVKTDYRIKHLYSLYRKLAKSDMNIDRVYDLAALRVIVPTVADCYSTLGIIHSIWKPLPGRIKDYIANPKTNGYQSLHTTVFAGDGAMVEIQIRTTEMHREAEYGVAAHAVYKEKGSVEVADPLLWIKKLVEPIIPGNNTQHPAEKLSQTPPWLQAIAQTEKDVRDSHEFVESVAVDFFEDRVFVFTPDGDVIDLPIGSTAIDFAYAVHTDIGARMSGAKINGKLSSLEKPLKSGDIVEIITQKNARPTAKWLEHAKTSLAKRKIRSSLGNK